MAVEEKRGCGYRQVGGLYLAGSGLAAPCDRLPLAITPCGVCGEQPRFSRGIAHINPLQLWGVHASCIDLATRPPDPICDPDYKAFLMWVGKEYTVNSFIAEARALGVSKRIPRIPESLKIGEDWVFLAKLHLIPPDNKAFTLDGDEQRGYGPGIFYAFKPERVEMILPDNQNTEALQEELKAKGITPVMVPGDDADHNRRKRQRVDKNPNFDGEYGHDFIVGRQGPMWDRGGEVVEASEVEYEAQDNA